jgi:hypothetical protein
MSALTRLASFYNGSAYNSGTNPGGFLQGGHVVNFIPALQDVASVAGDVATNATAAAASASAASASATSAAASAAALSGTSATSVAIGSGSKSFTTQLGKAFGAGVWLNIRSAANPSLNYMIGQVASYSAGLAVVSVPATGFGGSGTYNDWVIDVSGSVGVQGVPGNTGAQGASPAIQWNFSTGTSDSDPGNGLFRFDSATTSAIAFIYFDNLNKDSVDVTAWLDALDDSTNPTDRGRLFIMQPDTPQKFVTFKVTGAVIDGSGYRKVPVTYIASSAPAAVPFTNAAAIAVDFSPTSNKGADGAGSGDVIGPSGATDGAIALFNTTTGKLIKNSGVGIGTSGANVGRLDGNNTYSGTSAFSGPLGWSSTAIGTVANANALTVGPNGSTNPTLKVDTSTALAVTGLSIKSAALAAGLALAVLSSGTNENLTLDAKGAGTITLGGTSTGAISIARALIYGGVTLSNAVTGTGNMVLSASPTFTGTLGAAVIAATGALSTSDTTASTSTTTGSGKFAGGLGVAGQVSCRNIYTDILSTAGPHFANNAANYTATVAASSNVAILPASPASSYFLIFVAEASNSGNTALYMCAAPGAAVVLVGSTGNWVPTTTSPAAGKFTIAHNGTAFAIYNGSGVSYSFKTLVLAM